MSDEKDEIAALDEAWTKDPPPVRTRTWPGIVVGGSEVPAPEPTSEFPARTSTLLGIAAPVTPAQAKKAALKRQKEKDEQAERKRAQKLKKAAIAEKKREEARAKQKKKQPVVRTEKPKQENPKKARKKAEQEARLAAGADSASAISNENSGVDERTKRGRRFLMGGVIALVASVATAMWLSKN